MSALLINQYYNQLDRSFQFSKSKNEDTIKSYFWMLLNDYAKKPNYEVVREVYCMGTKGAKVKPDGILKNLWGIEVGYWESKDEKDNIEDEIDLKQKKGYPLTNTLFEDSQTAILFQRGVEELRVNMREAGELDKVLKKFVNFKNDTVYKFEDAIEKFKADIPVIVETLRKRIAETGDANSAYVTERDTFLALCQAEINPAFTLADVREMIIQHILTSDIFNKIFDDAEFHRHNTIAAELEKLISTLFTYSERRNLLASIEHYYDTINATAAAIADHHEKQKFLKVLYENFYKVYNPKAADRLGVVYTPNEIVKFMIESTDWLLHKHFGKTLSDKNVDILDPATGTGTFISDIIEYIPRQHLAWKYKHELHSNEVAILPYYISNLNIEFTFKQKMGYYEEFTNSCFVDTLDNTGALAYTGMQHAMFGLSSENAERIKRQNTKKISVVIGNPPYNANQQNENENNKNREYPLIDKRIKETFIKHSTAQKTKVYDMYARFYRWAMDRVDKNGIIAFITNRSFIDSRTFDGFRKNVQNEFSHCYIIDTRSDVRANPKIAGTTHNVFGIQTGVAIMFLVKKAPSPSERAGGEVNCRIEYVSMEDDWRKEIKLDWFRTNRFGDIAFASIAHDKNNNWINLSENDWESLISTANIQGKFGREQAKKNSIFSIVNLGISTNRDEWAYDIDLKKLKSRVDFFASTYNSLIDNSDNTFPDKIKWSNALKVEFKKHSKIVVHDNLYKVSLYRPFTKEYFFANKVFNDALNLGHSELFGSGLNKTNPLIIFTGPNSGKPFMVITTNSLFDLHVVGAGAGAQCLPLYRYTKDGERIDNITDWGLQQFRQHYCPEAPPSEGLGRLDIFHYTYAILHNPAYRKKYELNLKREFPRIPFYGKFFQWCDWGKQLMNLHINYETAEPYPLNVIASETKQSAVGITAGKQIASPPSSSRNDEQYARQPKIKVKLKADKASGIIEIDELTFLTGVPKEAWDYKLGNRSALEWVLDQYKEKKPTDPTIAEKFNTYRFADYKDKVIDLLKRVCTVSVETMKVVSEMEENNLLP